MAMMTNCANTTVLDPLIATIPNPLVVTASPIIKNQICMAIVLSPTTATLKIADIIVRLLDKSRLQTLQIPPT
jgi:hypothetical protein